MSLPGSRGLRAAGGMRAAWERQQQAAALAATAGRIPLLATSKPDFFAAQLRAVLAALQQLHRRQQPRQQPDAVLADEQGREVESGSSQWAAEKEAGAEWQAGAALAAAAAHLRRLEAADEQAGANASLLFWLLVELAGEAGLLAEPLLLPLLADLGWHGLLLEAQPLLDREHQQQVHAGLLAAATSAADGSSSSAQQQPAVQGLVALLAGRLEQQLQQYGSCGTGNSGGGSGEALPAGVDLLQQLLLVCPAAAAAPAAATALRQLQAAAEACTPRLMQAVQQGGQPALFQQVCQLRARLMLALAAAPADASEQCTAGRGPARCQALELAGSSADEPGAAQAWRAVLRMPASVPAAAAAAEKGPDTRPSRLEFLAACVAARCCLQASCAGSPSSGSPHSNNGGIQSSLQLEGGIPALPGVRFLPPRLPGVSEQPRIASSRSRMAAAAEAAAAEVAADPDCLGPAQLALATLQLAERVSARPAAMADPASPVLLDLAAAASAAASEPAQQRALLTLLLHGQQPWQRRLQGRLAADAQLQQRCRRDLVAVLNRLSADAGSSGTAAVHGEARRRRTAAAVAALLPHALLCPAVVLERLLRQALVAQGEQVDLLLDVLHEMRALALFCSAADEGAGLAGRAEQPALLALLARLLAPEVGTQQQQQQQQAPAPQAVSTLDTPGSRLALVQLVAGLCGLAPDHGKPAAAPPGADDGPLLSPAAVLQHVVVPALEGHLAGLAQRGAATPAAAAAAAVQGLHLPLKLAKVLLAGEAAARPAVAGAACDSASWAARSAAQQCLAPLSPLLQSLLAFQARRVDRSAVALAADSSTFELVASLLCRLDRTGGSSGGAGAYFLSQLQPHLLLHPGSTAAQQGRQLSRQQVQHLRRAMLELLAALLPCCTAAEASEVLHTALPTAIQGVLMPATAPGSSSGPTLPGARAAAVEAACRAAQMLALEHSHAPLAGEELPSNSSAPAEAAATPPSALRRAAVERMLQHLTQCCARLVAPASPSGAAPPAAAAEAGAGEAGPLQLGLVERQALVLRCFRELCQLAAALEPAGYDCGTLQACLLQLAAGQAGPKGTTAGAAGQHTPPTGLLPAQLVQEQMAAAAGTLHQGRLREVVLLAVEAGRQ